MLVLSRRPDQQVVFPGLGIKVRLLRIQGQTARLGIEAPPQIEVLRDEIAPAIDQAAVAAALVSNEELSHQLRNRLNAATLAAHMLEHHWQRGNTSEGQAMLERIRSELSGIEADLRTHDELVAPTKPATRTKRAEKSSKSSYRALLVEDDRNESELLAGYLRLSGFEVETAGDGSDALRYLKSSERPDVVLMDMLMPRCDGPTTVREIRRDPELGDLRIFAISATAPSSFGVTIGPGGVDRWFGKPLNPQALVTTMSEELRVAVG